MATKFTSVLDALLAASLVTFMFGVFMTMTDYVLLSAAIRFLESRAVLPTGWGGSHIGLKQLIAMALAIAPVAFVGWRMYRLARQSDPAA